MNMRIHSQSRIRRTKTARTCSLGEYNYSSPTDGCPTRQPPIELPARRCWSSTLRPKPLSGVVRILLMMLQLLFGTSSWSTVSYRPKPIVGVIVLAFVVVAPSSSPPRRVSGGGGSPTTTAAPFLSCGCRRHRQQRQVVVRCWAASVHDDDEPDWNTSDPFRLLGIPRDHSSDTKAIKRAYRRLALRYHPDVVTGTAEKKVAAERFAKINWAYQMAKSGQSTTSSTTGRTSTSSTSTSASGWEPPHRRSGTYRSTSSSDSASSGTPSSTDWRDYMPRDYQEEDAKYDAGGDSFEKILSDLFQGATAAVGGGGGGGIFKDFVEFLEQNVDGYSSGGTSGRDDAEELRILLQTGDVQEIRDEMDETELVVQQLTSKLQNVRDERLQVQADLAAVSRYMEKMELQERMDELQARQTVVEGYMQRAKKRLVALQTRYKELLVRGTPNDGRGGQSSSGAGSSWEDVKRESRSESSTSRQSAPSSSDPDEAWKDEGFGSFGRGSGSSRRRAARRTTGTDAGSRSRSSSTTENNSSSWSSFRSGSTTGTSTSQSESPSRQASRATDESTTRVVSQRDPYVPPHRRKSEFAQQQDNQRRLREIKVDEEFDKLKKELGL